MCQQPDDLFTSSSSSTVKCSWNSTALPITPSMTTTPLPPVSPQAQPLQRKRKYSVQFSDVTVHEHAVTLGDHPCCSSGGPPLSLSWERHCHYQLPLDLFEAVRTNNAATLWRYRVVQVAFHMDSNNKRYNYTATSNNTQKHCYTSLESLGPRQIYRNNRLQLQPPHNNPFLQPPPQQRQRSRPSRLSAKERKALLLLPDNKYSLEQQQPQRLIVDRFYSQYEIQQAMDEVREQRARMQLLKRRQQEILFPLIQYVTDGLDELLRPILKQLVQCMLWMIMMVAAPLVAIIRCDTPASLDVDPSCCQSTTAATTTTSKKHSHQIGTLSMLPWLLLFVLLFFCE